MSKTLYSRTAVGRASSLLLNQTTPQTITNDVPILDALTASELVSTDATKQLQSLPVATYPSLTELSYVKGLTSSAQTQLDRVPASTAASDFIVGEAATGKYVKKTLVETQALIGPGIITSSISDSDTTHAPDGNSIFDALALKANKANPDITGTASFTGTTTTASLGSELITTTADRDFSGAGNWSGTNWTVGSGVFTHTAGANAATLAGYAAEAGSYYQIVFTANTTTAGTLTVSYGGTSGIAIGQAVATDTAQTQVVLATNTNGLVFTPDTNWAGTLDDISVKKITPSTATQILRNSNGTIGNEFRSGGNGLDNTFNGVKAGLNNVSGSSNTANGINSLFSNTTGSYNTANGVSSLFSNTTGSSNTANGVNSLLSNTTGSSNTANGINSLLSNTTGSYNTANGHNVLQLNTIGSSNTANGINSLLSNTTGSSNTANGVNSLLSNTTGNYNTANGINSLYSNTTGSYNIANGVSSLFSNTTGSSNTANGRDSLNLNTTGSYNTANGRHSLYSNTTGSYNTANGYEAGGTLTTGSNNTFLGYNSGNDASQKVDAVNSTAIGNGAYTTADNQVVIGNSSVTATQLRGNVDVPLELTAGTKTFKIDHPVIPNDKILYHMAIEGPRVDLIYRGTVNLVNGKAMVDLNKDSSFAGMMSGTFEALTQNAKVTSLHASDSFDRVKSSEITGSTFNITSENTDSTDSVSWVVMAERNDAFIRNMSKTDDDGHLITEWDKEDPDLSLLEDDTEFTNKIEENEDVTFEPVFMVGKGYKLHPEAFGEELETKKVTKIFKKVEVEEDSVIYDKHTT